MDRKYPSGVKFFAWFSVVTSILGLAIICVVAALVAVGKMPSMSSFEFLGKPVQSALISTWLPFVFAALLCAGNLAVAIYLLKAQAWAYYTMVALLGICVISNGVDIAGKLVIGKITINLNLLLFIMLLYVLLSERKRFLDYAKLQRSESPELVQTAAD